MPAQKNQWSARFEGNDIYLRTPYNELFVGQLKQVVPPNERWWDNWHREWKIDVESWSDVQELLQQFFGDDGKLFDVIERQDKRPRKTAYTVGPHGKLV